MTGLLLDRSSTDPDFIQTITFGVLATTISIATLILAYKQWRSMRASSAVGTNLAIGQEELHEMGPIQSQETLEAGSPLVNEE